MCRRRIQRRACGSRLCCGGWIRPSNIAGCALRLRVGPWRGPLHRPRGRAVGLSALHWARGLRRRLRASRRRLCSRPRVACLMWVALMRLGTGSVGRGLGRCHRGGLCRRAGRIAAVCSGRGLGGIAAQIPAFGLFDRIGAVVPMAARRRLSGGCRQTSIFRPHGVSAHAASGKNDQSTQNGKRSCFRQFPLASHVIASPSNHRPSAPTRRYSPRFRTGLKNIAAKTCYPAAVSTIFFCESRAIGLPGQASGPLPPRKHLRGFAP